jgi:hypothetical protein
VLEDVKDTAVALYSRDVAMRVRERRARLDDFAHLSTLRATALARQYAVTISSPRANRSPSRRIPEREVPHLRSAAGRGH